MPTCVLSLLISAVACHCGKNYDLSDLEMLEKKLHNAFADRSGVKSSTGWEGWSQWTTSRGLLGRDFKLFGELLRTHCSLAF